MNLFDVIPRAMAEELIEPLVETPHARLERIVSLGHATPPGQWLDQERDEWVVLLSGSAGLRFEDEHEVRPLRAGDHLVIAAHRRHRVEWTEATAASVWLALHYGA